MGDTIFKIAEDGAIEKHARYSSAMTHGIRGMQNFFAN